MMAWLRRLCSAVTSFTARAYKQPIWMIATFIFLSCVTFLITYQSSSPEGQAKIEYSANERRVLIEDGERLTKLYGQILAEVESMKRLMFELGLIVDDITETRRVEGRGSQVEMNYKSAVETKRQVGLLLASVKGMQFRVPAYNEEARAYETYLTTEMSMLEAVEGLWAAYLAGDAKDFARKSAEAAGRLSAIFNDQLTFASRQESLGYLIDSTLNANLIELKKAEAQANRHRVLGWLQILAVIFMVGYAGAVWVGIKNSVKAPTGASAAIPRARAPGCSRSSITATKSSNTTRGSKRTSSGGRGNIPTCPRSTTATSCSPAAPDGRASTGLLWAKRNDRGSPTGCSTGRVVALPCSEYTRSGIFVSGS